MAREHPEPSLESFCRREYPRLVGAISLYCGEADIAEDLAQETIARVCSNWPKVRRMEMPGAWAHRVAINLVASHYRRRVVARRALSKLRGGTEMSYMDPDTPVSLAIRRAIATLPHRQKTVIVLRYYVGLSVNEVAEATGIPPNTVKTSCRRALLALRGSREIGGLELVDAK